jgi:hypothetical protein
LVALLCLALLIASKARAPSKDGGYSSSAVQTGDSKIRILEKKTGSQTRTNKRAPANRNDGDLKSVSDFQDKFDSIDENLSGSKLVEARMKLMLLASKTLSLGDLESLADQLRGKVYHSSITGFLALRLAEEDPKKGFEWLIKESKWEDSSSASLAFAGACKFDSFPADVLDKFGSNKKKALFIEGMMSNASYNATRDALAYLAIHPEVSRLNGNLVPLCFDSSLQKGNLKETLELCKVLDGKPLKKAMIDKIFAHASSSDPKSAQQLLQSVHNESDRSVAILSLAASWGDSQPDKVAEWVSQLSTPQEQDAAKEGLVRAITHSDPASALEWARSISDTGRRDALVSKLVKQFNISDPDLVK